MSSKAITLLIKAILMIIVPVPAVFGQTDAGQMLQTYRGAGQTGSQRSGSTSMAPKDIDKLVIGPGFALDIFVLDDTDFNGRYRVDETGAITVPVLGRLQVTGKTSFDVLSDIQRALLEKQILRNPQVEVSVAEYVAPMVTVLGEVKSPGKYPLLAPSNLTDVIALAGGLSALAGDRVEITSSEPQLESRNVQYTKDTNAAEGARVIVRSGDTVQVMRAGVVYVLGDVNRPGGYVMQENGSMTLLQAISLANGTSSTASLKKIFVLRTESNGTVTRQSIPYKKIASGNASDVVLRERDIIVVPGSMYRLALMNSQAMLRIVANAAVYSALR